MKKFEEIKPKPASHNGNASGGIEFEYNGVPFMTLATNRTPYTAVNLETGDLCSLKDRDVIGTVHGKLK